MTAPLRPRRLCVVTATRAEYGLLRWLMHSIQADAELQLQVVVTGTHLSPAHGLTYRDIERDGFRIDRKVEMLLGSDSPVATTQSMGVCLLAMGPTLDELRPDVLVVLGDRYELLPLCSVATVMNIPIAHISGGDVTEGAIDNQVRHAVSKLAHLHFPGTAESAARLIQMGEDPARVFTVGEPGLENIRRVERRPRDEVAARLGLDPAMRWVVCAYHPETLLSAQANRARAEAVLDLLARLPDVEVMMTHPNADPGGLEIAGVLERYHHADPLRFRLVKSLGQDGFVDLLREAYAIVGNSSAGVVEAASVGLRAVNVGDRQTGRLQPPNVVSSDGSAVSLAEAWSRIEAPGFGELISGLINPYGDGHTAERIKTVLASVPLEALLRKGFHEADRR